MVIKKINIVLFIFILIILLIALLFCIKNIIFKESTFNENNSSFSEVSKAVNDFYKFTDSGDFENLYKIVVEGIWEKENGSEGKYEIIGLTGMEDFLVRSSKLFGEKGEYFNLNSFSIDNISKISNKDFITLFPREGDILKLLDKDKYRYDSLYKVNVIGYRQSCCALLRWEKNIPVVRMDNNSFKIILCRLIMNETDLYKEQWFKNTSF